MTKHLLREVLQLPAGVEIVGAAECPYADSVDLVLSGPGVPDAERCRATVKRERVSYEFTPLGEDKK